MKKPKGKSLHDSMLMDGTIHYGVRSDGVIIEKGKPVADVVAPIVPKVNAAPRITDAPRKTPPIATVQAPELTGLQRAIAANAAKGARAAHTVSSNIEPTGLQRAIAANIKLQRKQTT